jgi:hypothetical protein
VFRSPKRNSLHSNSEQVASDDSGRLLQDQSAILAACCSAQALWQSFSSLPCRFTLSSKWQSRNQL